MATASAAVQRSLCELRGLTIEATLAGRQVGDLECGARAFRRADPRRPAGDRGAWRELEALAGDRLDRELRRAVIGDAIKFGHRSRSSLLLQMRKDAAVSGLPAHKALGTGAREPRLPRARMMRRRKLDQAVIGKPAQARELVRDDRAGAAQMCDEHSALAGRESWHGVESLR
jgi:hypothetical protein